MYHFTPFTNLETFLTFGSSCPGANLFADHPDVLLLMETRGKSLDEGLFDKFHTKHYTAACIEVILFETLQRPRFSIRLVHQILSGEYTSHDFPARFAMFRSLLMELRKLNVTLWKEDFRMEYLLQLGTPIEKLLYEPCLTPCRLDPIRCLLQWIQLMETWFDIRKGRTLAQDLELMLLGFTENLYPVFLSLSDAPGQGMHGLLRDCLLLLFRISPLVKLRMTKKMLMDVSGCSWGSRSKYVIMNILLDSGIPVWNLEDFCGNIYNGILKGIRASSLKVLIQQLHTKYVSRISLNDWLAKFRDEFIRSAVACWDNHTCRKNVVQHFLPSILRTFGIDGFPIDYLQSLKERDQVTPAMYLLFRLVLLRYLRVDTDHGPCDIPAAWLNDVVSGLTHFDVEIRSEAFRLLCDHRKKALLPTQQELDLISFSLQDFVDTAEPGFRNSLERSLKTLFMRVVGGLRSSKAKQQLIESCGQLEDISEDIASSVTFVLMFIPDLLSAFESRWQKDENFSYQSIAFLMKIHRIWMEQLMSENIEHLTFRVPHPVAVQFLLRTLENPSNDIREEGFSQLKQFASDEVIIDHLERVLEEAILKLDKPNFESAEIGASYFGIVSYVMQKISRIPVSLSTRIGFHDVRQLHDFLLCNLLTRIQRALENPVTAACSAPVYGYVLALLECLKHIDSESFDNFIQNSPFVLQSSKNPIIALINLSLELLRQEVKEEEDFIAPSFEDMADSLWSLVKQTDPVSLRHVTQTDDGTPIDEVWEIAKSHLGNFCWLNLKYATTFIGFLLTKCSTSLFLDMKAVATRYVHQLKVVLLECRHKGAIEFAKMALIDVLNRFYNSSEQDIGLTLLKEILSLVERITNHNVSTTRRGAGIVLIIEALLNDKTSNEQRVVQLQLTLEAMDYLFEISSNGLEIGNEDVGLRDSSLSSSLHLLALIFSCTHLESALKCFEHKIFVLAVDAMSSNCFPIQNAALSLFGALVKRFSGFKNVDFSGQEIAELRGLDELFLLHPWLKEELQCSFLKRRPEVNGFLLCLLSRFSRRTSNLAESPGQRSDLCNFLFPFISNSHSEVRSSAAKIIAHLFIETEEDDPSLSIIRKVASESPVSWNVWHGCFMLSDNLIKISKASMVNEDFIRIHNLLRETFETNSELRRFTGCSFDVENFLQNSSCKEVSSVFQPSVTIHQVPRKRSLLEKMLKGFNFNMKIYSNPSVVGELLKQIMQTTDDQPMLFLHCFNSVVIASEESETLHYNWFHEMQSLRKSLATEFQGAQQTQLEETVPQLELLSIQMQTKTLPENSFPIVLLMYLLTFPNFQELYRKWIMWMLHNSNTACSPTARLNCSRCLLLYLQLGKSFPTELQEACVLLLNSEGNTSEIVCGALSIWKSSEYLLSPKEAERLLRGNSIVEINIPQTLNVDTHTLYVVRCTVGGIWWCVKRRYREFGELHEALMSKHGLPKELLPPKKFIGNMSPSFVEKRRNDLELYLREVLKFLRLALPKEFLEFLDFPRIEVACHMQAFARMLAVEGDKLLEGNAPLRLSPLKLHAITERLQLPCPPLDLEGTADDFSHVVDYISQVRVLYATGSDEPLEQSNVVPNLFDFELGPFKSLQRLHLVSINVKRIKGIGGLREILEELHACNCGMTQLRHLLLCDLVHQDETTIAAALKEHKYIWTAVKVARFSGNQLRAIDPSVKLLPTVKSLDFSCNQITSIQNMTGLPYMTDLNLSFNALSSLQDLHTKLGQVVSLDLSSNNISSLEGFGRLFSLEKLDLSCNRVSDISQVSHVASLPCLDTLVFVGNPMTLAVDYRVKVLQQFEASRVPTLLLDHEHPTQKETDKVAVLQALRKAREGHPLTKVMASP